MTIRPDRGDVMTREAAADTSRVKRGRGDASADADFHGAAATERHRAALRRGRAAVDLTTLESLRRPS